MSNGGRPHSNRSAHVMQENNILRERMKEALRLADQNATQAALAIGRDRNYFRDFLKPHPKKNSLSSGDLKKFAELTGVSMEWLHGSEGLIAPTSSPANACLTQANARPAPPNARPRLPNGHVAAQNIFPKLIPLYGNPMAGEEDGFPFTGVALAHVPCPPFLDRAIGAYAIGICGASMEPRYRPGEVAFASPSRMPRPGDDVVLQVDVNGQLIAYIKELLHLGAEQVVLKQHNPKKEIGFPREDVRSIFVIEGMATR